MLKIILEANSPTPKVVHPSAEFVFENARGGPYKYGVPIFFNSEAAERLRNGGL